MRRNVGRRAATFIFLLWLTPLSEAAERRLPKPGFNLFSVDQDIQLGREGMAEIEKQVKLLDNREVTAYIEGIGKKLAATPEAGDFPYTFKVVHDESINAFALPGGPTYVNSGLILAADSEAQIAGVMGHEIAHVVLRHGTNQASKANLLQLGAMLGGSMLGGGSIAGSLAQLGIGFGANSVLMKFSRSAESDADILGAHMMSRAGYNPIEAARFFEKLEAESGSRSGVAEFFSSHPNPGNRTARIKEEIASMPRRDYRSDSGGLARIQQIIRGLPPPPKKNATASGGAAGSQPAGGAAGTSAPAGSPGTPPPSRAGGSAPAPSAEHQTYQGREFRLTYPRNWKTFGDSGQGSTTFAPENGLAAAPGGGNAVVRGMVTGKVASRSGQPVELQRDTQALIQQMQQQNPGLKASGRRPRQMRVDNSPALLVTMFSPSPLGGETEVDMLVTVARPGALHYLVFVAPQKEYRQYQPTFEKILASIKFSN